MSNYQKSLGEKCDVKYGIEKLCLTLNSKEKYVLHYRNLKQYMKHGLKLKKVYRVLRFRQSPWLKPFIGINTKYRQEAKNQFEINLYKLMNNSVYGKTCEDVRKYNDVKIVQCEEKI